MYADCLARGMTPAPRDYISLAAFLGVVILIAGMGTASTLGAADDYGELVQPAWAPPSWLFGPVWTVLYAMIAIAGWLIWRDEKWGLSTGLWAGQMVVNGLWSPMFFAWELRLQALVWIVLLDILVAWLIARQWKRTAAWLLLPYLAWIAFATVLNASIWWLNRAA